MSDIKIFVCCHKEDQQVPEHPLLNPIQVGTALSDTRFTGFLHDDEGENISELNRSYCELTAQYWAWKNIQTDYYGFFHYRRYLYPDFHSKKPYRIKGEVSETCLNRLGYSIFVNEIEQYDLIIPVGEDMHVSVREHYASAPYHHAKDLSLIEQIIRERFPEYIQAMDEYFGGTVCYFGNIYIMKAEIFQEYCEWLFAILKEFDRSANCSGYSAQELRVDGYLAERLLGIYVTNCRCVNDKRVCELPRVHFVDGKWEFIKKKMSSVLLPPGSVRRAFVKRKIIQKA